MTEHNLEDMANVNDSATEIDGTSTVIEPTQSVTTDIVEPTMSTTVENPVITDVDEQPEAHQPIVDDTNDGMNAATPVIDREYTDEGLNAATPVIDPEVAEIVQTVNDNEDTDDNTQEGGEEVTPEVAEVIDYINLHAYITAYYQKLTNVNLISLAGITGIPDDRHLVFKTDNDDDSSLILFDRPARLWLDNVEPTTIRVEQSGIIIDGASNRTYIGKGSIVKFQKDVEGTLVSMTTVSKSLTADGIKVTNNEVEVASCDANVVKLHIKSISAKLYKVIEDLESRESIKEAIITFMVVTKDINHLIKLDKVLMLGCQL
jgi:hypothetical protein